MGALKRHTSEAGMTLIEQMVLVAIIITIMAAVGMSFRTDSQRANATFTGLQSALDRAETTAQEYANGATIVAFPNTNSAGTTIAGIQVYVCQGRPNGQGMGNCAQHGVYNTTTNIVPPGGSSITPPWAIYVNSDRTLAGGAWPTSQSNTLSGSIQTVASEPSCPAGQTLQIAIQYSFGGSTPSVPCSGGILSRSGSNGF